MLHKETLTPAAFDLLENLMKVEDFHDLKLVGGTSLALQFGHRKSIDLDLFGKLEIDKDQIHSILRSLGEIKLLNQTDSINVYLINGIKVDLVNYNYQWIEGGTLIEGIRMASIPDICAMKLAAIAGRGSKKDFFDINYLLKKYSLKQMLDFFNHKYPDGSRFLVTKSLTYFEDAELEPDPVMLVPTDWESVKESIRLETKKISF